jgi:hypothetical protein
MGLVKLSIENLRPKRFGNRMIQDVGGPIDAAKLGIDGRITWVARKENCPEN